jgi:hypothetical protein
MWLSSVVIIVVGTDIGEVVGIVGEADVGVVIVDDAIK